MLIRELSGTPHRRFNPLRGDWVLVSPHRTARPWQGQIDRPSDDRAPEYDPTCYLCPGNARAHGERNPQYTSTFAFDNDFAALLPDAPKAASAPQTGPGDLFVAAPERGICRVLCFTPRHDVTIPLMSVPAIRSVVDAWAGEYEALAAKPWLAYAAIFENRGAMMGASNPHPHCQIWATEHLPNEPQREAETMAAYRARSGGCMLCDYLAAEERAGERIVCANDAFAAIVPFWALWPFEAIVISRRHTGAIGDLGDAERTALADILKRLTVRYDNLFETPFPYSMGFHQRPFHAADADAHLHAHYYPPLLRSATVRKFMVCFELLGSPQRDLTPEQAAERLQSMSEQHYAPR